MNTIVFFVNLMDKNRKNKDNNKFLLSILIVEDYFE